MLLAYDFFLFVSGPLILRKQPAFANNVAFDMFEVLLEVIASCFPIISKTDPRPTADVFAHNEIAIHAD
jgi:hypothetical protein